MILIVDDQKDIGAGLERLHRDAGHGSVSVTSGVETQAMLLIRKPSLFLRDVNHARNVGAAAENDQATHGGAKRRADRDEFVRYPPRSHDRSRRPGPTGLSGGGPA